MKIATIQVLSVTSILLACTCQPPAPAQVAPPYQPHFSYAVPPQAAKVDITVGVVAPQFSGQGLLWWTMNRAGETPRALVGGLRSSFAELLSAKGFNTTGPFDSIDAMTFPEKKGSDFVLYPEIDLAVSEQVVPGSLVVDGNAMRGEMHCQTAAAGRGNVQLLVKEPLSGEKIWVKRLEVSTNGIPPSSTTGHACMGVASMGGQGETDGLKKAHEAVYKAIMEALNKYVSGEEFQMLKKQAAELRAKKVY